MSTPLIRLGTRGSPLALAQTEIVRKALIKAWPDLADPGALETVVIKTTGDRVQDRPLSAIGGKGLFTKELEEALLAKRIDVAVHSVKDMPSFHQEDLFLACTLKREDPRDAIISRTGIESVGSAPPRATLGTSSLRRQCQVLALRSDLRIKMLRGNVETRLARVESGELDAIMLAVAGLKRLGLAHRITGYLDPSDVLPAVGQGVIGCEIRVDDDHIFEYLQPLNHRVTHYAVTAERSMLHQLEGNCRTPIAGLAMMDGGDLWLTGLVGTPDGGTTWRVQLSAKPDDALTLGREVGVRIQQMAGANFPRIN